MTLRDERAAASTKRPLSGIKLRPSGAVSGFSTFEELYKVLQWEIRPTASKRRKTFAQKPPTESEKLAALRPYAEAVGHANFEWNKYQQWLSLCFWKIFDSNGEEALAIWDSLTSDRMQRNILLETAKVKFIARSHHPNTTVSQMNKWYEIYDSIEFLHKSGEKFEDMRNNAIHAPIDLRWPSEHFVVYVDDQHVRGSAFKSKMRKRNTDIMDELLYLKKSLQILNVFANKFWHAWVKDQTLPQIPNMPNLVPRKKRKPLPQKNVPK